MLIPIPAGPQFIDQWPILQPGVESRYFSSFDRAGGNDDGFNGTYSALYVEPNGEHVIFDDRGPGCLRTLWFTSETSGHGKLSLGKVRFYFDDEPKPRIEIDGNDIFAGKTNPFTKPLVADNYVSTGGYASWVALPYSGRLKITTENRAFFYIAQYDHFPCDWKIATWTPQFKQPLQELFQNPIPRRSPKQVPLTQEGSGVIRALRFEPTQKPTKAQLQSARIKIWWDNEPDPAVDCPLGMFFGTGLGEAKVRALAFSIQDGVYENRLPMPYWKGFRIQVEGLEGKLSLDIAKQRYDRKTAGHLHAFYSKEHPTKLHEDHTMLDTAGAGKLVGTVLCIQPDDPNQKRWWEGDLRSYTNGKRTPGLHGTGHEDDHLGGWSNEFLDTPFTLPMHGEPTTELMTREGQYNGNCSLYRLWPGINFVDGIRHSVEHGNENHENYNYSSVAFFYKVDGLTLTQIASYDANQLAPAGAKIEELTSTFEGRDYQKPVTMRQVVTSAPVTLKVDVPANTEVLLVRRTYDQSAGRQDLIVEVDGHKVGEWYAPEENQHCRWAERDFYLPVKPANRPRPLTITLRPKTPTSFASLALLTVVRQTPNGNP